MFCIHNRLPLTPYHAHRLLVRDRRTNSKLCLKFSSYSISIFRIRLGFYQIYLPPWLHICHFYLFNYFHYAASRKFDGLIPDEVIRFFSLLNHSSCNMALGSTYPLREISTRNLLGGKGRLAPHRHLWTNCLESVGASTSHKPMGLHGLLRE
jgi:hypothetical protein